MKQTFKLNIAVLVFCVTSFSLISHPAFAYDLSFLKDTSVVKNVDNTVKNETEDVEKRAQKVTDTTSKNISKNVDKSTENSATRQNRFNANQTKKCEKKQQKISDKLDVISTRGTKQLEVFHSIASRVQHFYTQKGYAAEGYDTLVTELDMLYDQSLVAVTSTQNASDAWGCTVQDPIASLENFKATKRAETVTLKAYKDKVRELIVLVKQAGGTN